MVDLIFQDSQECMILVDGTTLLIEFLNQATKNIFSVNYSLVSTSVVHFFAKKNVSLSVDEIRKDLEGKGYYIQHVEFQKEDGESFWGNMYIRRLEAENTTKWFIRIFDESAQFKASSLLRENWNTFARVLDAIPHKIFLKDPSSRFLLINSILEQVHGMPKEALIGKTDFDLFPSHFAETYYNHEQEIMKTGSVTMPVEETVQMPDGSTRIFKISKIPFYLPEYKANGLLGLGIDVTQVYNYQEKLRKSEANYRMLLEQASDGIYSADKLGIIADANPKACQMLGYSKGELVGLNVKSLIDEKDDRFFNIELLKNEHKRSLILERKFKQKGGAVFIVELSVTIFDDGGHQGIMRDITERKRVESIIQGNEKKFRALIESSYDITAILNDKLQMVFVSPSVQKILGYVPQKIQGKTLFEFIHPEDKESAELFLRQLLGRPEEFKILPEIRMLGLDGQYRYFEMAGNNLMADSAVNGLVINLHDISERKTTELKLLNANYELDSFVYRVSHDIKAPLRSVMGLIGIAKMENQQVEINTYLDMMNKSVLNLDQFIKDLIQFSRNSRMELEVTNVDFNKILDACIEDLRYMEKVDKIEIRKNVEPNLQFQSDNLRINTIIGNLLSNSLKYHKFEAGISYVSVSVSENQGDIEILVEDNGVGIGQEYQNKIFDMFYRASEMSSGSGLGLYIVKTAVSKLKGSIEVHSTPNVGTKFKIVLPQLTTTNNNG
jgi:PAS domain S-box-containing protein